MHTLLRGMRVDALSVFVHTHSISGMHRAALVDQKRSAGRGSAARVGDPFTNVDTAVMTQRRRPSATHSAPSLALEGTHSRAFTRSQKRGGRGSGNGGRGGREVTWEEKRGWGIWTPMI